MTRPDTKATRDLDTVLQASLSLLQQLQVALAEIHRNPSIPPPVANDETPIDALALARDSTSLIRAHSTKLSLLIVNEPFTPTAILSIIRDLTSGPIPCLAASLEACRPELYTAAYRRELAWRCRAVLLELGQLLQKVPKDGKALPGSNQGFGADGGKGSIALTGLLWSACDDTVGLTNMGVGGFFVKKVEEWRDTLTDVMEELKEWGDEEPDNDEDDGEVGGDDMNEMVDQMNGSHIDSTQDMLDDLMNSNLTIPRSDPDNIRPRLETSLKRLRMVSILYQAITKRRMKKLPTFPPSDALNALPRKLDELTNVLGQLPDRFGDLACAFYELQPAEIDQVMDQCFVDAYTASDVMSQTWEGGRDEFTEWTEKFQAEIRKE